MSGKLTPEEFDQWIKELNNPENKQTTGELTDNFDKPSAYCCLGLLSYKVLNNSNYPRESNKMEIPAENHCINWNDADRLTFPQIAQKLIENRTDYVEESKELGH